MILEEQYTDAEIKGLLCEAVYHLGRVRYEGKRDFDGAVSALEQAVDLDPDNIPAYYYLGQAIVEQVKRNKLTRARNLLRHYLTHGAPVGHEDEVREFIGARKSLTTP